MKKIFSLHAFLFFVGLQCGFCQTINRQYQLLEEKITLIKDNYYDDLLPKSALDLISEFNSIKAGTPIDREQLRFFEQKVDLFVRKAIKVKNNLGKTIDYRNALLGTTLTSGKDAKIFYQGEKFLFQAIAYGDKGSMDSANIFKVKAMAIFKPLLNKAANDNNIKNYEKTLKKIEKGMKEDIQLLGKINTIGSDNINQYNDLIARMQNNQLSTVGGFTYEPPTTWPPLPAPKGPKPPETPFFNDISSKSIVIGWRDMSDNENGSRIYRAAKSNDNGSYLDPEVLVADLPVYPKDSIINFVDSIGLLADTKYCYWVSAYNAEGERRSYMVCTYTKTDEKIPVLRLRARIQVDDVKDAGCDCKFSIGLGYGGGNFTYLDYSRDDLERGSIFEYDLNIKNIKNIFDINSISLFNASEDAIKLKKFEIFIDWDNAFSDQSKIENNPISSNKIFDREWLQNDGWIENGGRTISYFEIREHPLWKAYINNFNGVSDITKLLLNFPIKLLPRTSSSVDTLKILISKIEIESRIESIIGHNINAGIDQKPGSTFDYDDLIFFNWHNIYTSINPVSGLLEVFYPFQISVKDDSTLSVFAHLDPYSLGSSEDSNLSGWFKDFVTGPFKINFDISFSINIDTSTIIENNDTLILFKFNGKIKVPDTSINIDGSPSLGGRILTGLILRGGFFYAGKVFDAVLEKCILPDNLSLIDESFSQEFRISKNKLSGISFDPNNIKILFRQDGNLEGCCIYKNN